MTGHPLDRTATSPPDSLNSISIPGYVFTWFALAAEFRQYLVLVVGTGPRPRYIAVALALGTHPHTVITADPDEMRRELAAGTGGGAGREPGPPQP
jgi:threonine dehydrogenase-like Zn-dependent dehydrogenase